ncbi:TlpA family protein disulfide reductase [Persicitalea sp.]|uniref:TlpA family protein disulfide reductase n=1 Tax=Persicitalea sp. TaxID=3100273 RepID=UPI00359453AB
MKAVSTLLFTLLTVSVWAQSSARINIASATEVDYIYSLTLERVRFHETLGVGLAETEYETIDIFDLSIQKDGSTTFPVDKPLLVRMTIASKRPVNDLSPSQMRRESRTQLLYIVPNENLTISVNPGNELTFEGKNVAHQEFLQNYFLENHYQYLPAFRFNPKKIDNDAIVTQSDSLAQLRLTQYETFRAAHPVDSTFDNYVRATTHVEPYLMRVVVRDRQMRQNTPVKLTPEQRKELNKITLDNFELYPDEALFSLAYRNELRNWILIPITEKYPQDIKSQFMLGNDAILEVYERSKEKLGSYPKQQEYLLTYWLNYAVTALPSMKPARIMFTDFEQRFPNSKVKDYFAEIITAKEKLEKGQSAPDFTLLDKDSSSVSLSSLRGKPLAVAFAFNLKQHEPTLKLLEEAKGDSVLFVYVSVAPGIPFGTWKDYVEVRPHALHLYASDEEIEKLKAVYAVEPRFPFMVIDEAGRFVNRWIPQEFPDNPTLQKELRSAVGQ